MDKPLEEFKADLATLEKNIFVLIDSFEKRNEIVVNSITPFTDGVTIHLTLK